MADKMKSTATVDSQVMLSDGIYSMWLKFPKEQDVASKAVPGYSGSAQICYQIRE